MDLFGYWIIFSIVPAIIAASKGRSGFGYFLLALIISPLLCLVIVLVLSNLNTPAAAAGPSPDTHIKCPDCRELILKDARVCKHCKCKLIPQA